MNDFLLKYMGDMQVQQEKVAKADRLDWDLHRMEEMG
jgi:hypothetical protein